MEFADFIAPMAVETFVADYFGKRPVHIRGASPRSGLLSMERLEQLLAVRPHWTEQNIKLILNSRPIAGEHFMDAKGATRLADPAKVEMFLRMGASLVGDHVEAIEPVVRGATAMLSRQFAGTAGANVYCSFQGIRAFASHCDLHEVFAVQIEGEKVWQIYENRADAPVETIQGPDAQGTIDRAKGRVMMTVTMQPGDLLYIPRGFFHDALASSDASLHLTFGVEPVNGLALFGLMETLAKRDPKFRAYLPDGRSDPAALRERLGELGEAVTEMLRSPLFEIELIKQQRKRVLDDGGVALRERKGLDHFATTGAGAQVVWQAGGAVLLHRGGETPVGILGEPVEWALGQQSFTAQQLGARYKWLSADEVTRVIQLLTGEGLFARYQPKI
jgi:lysine-specific demethylase/histidyl-hydroxylase NO66